MGLKNLIGMYSDRDIREALQGMFGVVTTDDGVVLHLFNLEITFGSTSIAVKKKGATSNIFEFNYNSTKVAKAAEADKATILASKEVSYTSLSCTTGITELHDSTNSATSTKAWTMNWSDVPASKVYLLVSAKSGGTITITNDHSAARYLHTPGQTTKTLAVGATAVLNVTEGVSYLYRSGTSLYTNFQYT